MTQSEQKVVQYLNEAHATEVGLVSVLQSQIAISPHGSYREGLEKHLEETREHARRLRERLVELGHGGNPFQALVGLSEAVIGQMVALSKAPFDLWRGASGAEKVLKDAKDACASEALEIATYTALERLAAQVGDAQTARLAASIRRDEDRMLARILREIPKLTDAVAQAEIEHRPSDDITMTAAADAAREVTRQANKTAQANEAARANKTGRATKTPQDEKAEGSDKTPPTTRARARDTTRQAGPARRSRQAERQRQHAARSREDLPIQRYGSLSAEEIAGRLPQLSQAELAKIDAHERSSENRNDVLTRISQLRNEEPWPGYDELTVTEIEAVLNEGDLQRAQAVADYERGHKNRPEVIRSAVIPARFLLSSASR